MKQTRFGRLIDERCATLGKTQGEIAAEVGISGTYLSMMKKGKRGCEAPRHATVRRLATVLGLDFLVVLAAIRDEPGAAEGGGRAVVAPINGLAALQASDVGREALDALIYLHQQNPRRMMIAVGKLLETAERAKAESVASSAVKGDENSQEKKRSA